MANATTDVIAPRVIIVPRWDNPTLTAGSNISGQLVMSGAEMYVWVGDVWDKCST